MTRRKTPTPGQEWAAGVLDRYELDPAEAAQLDHAARTLDELDRMGRALARGSILVPGSRGQDVVNPLVAAIAAHRKLLESLCRGLGLPTPEGNRKKSARHAASVSERHRRNRLSSVRGDGA